MRESKWRNLTTIVLFNDVRTSLGQIAAIPLYQQVVEKRSDCYWTVQLGRQDNGLLLVVQTSLCTFLRYRATPSSFTDPLNHL